MFCLFIASFAVSAEEIHINGQTGNDSNPGSLTQPIRTLNEAARRVNVNYTKEAATLLLAAGVYDLTQTALFMNPKFTANERLTIKAEIMPDDANWTPQQMPIIAAMIPMVLSPFGDEMAKGIEIETSHVTIGGLRFVGEPAYYYIDGKHARCYYPIWREGKSLDDLLVTQCMFTGNHDVAPVRVAVIANGNGLVLDHDVFYNCENSVVFWDGDGGKSTGNAMKYCLVYGNNYSGVWTTDGTAEDFDFHHNIISSGHIAWIRDNEKQHYSGHDAIFTANEFIAGFGNDKNGTSGLAGSSDLLKAKNIRTEGKIEIEKDQSKRNYLQLKEGSFGQDLKAGLFKN